MRNHNWTTLLLSGVVAAFLTIPAVAADPVSPDRLQVLAENASTTAEHAEVAKHYRLRGEAFQAEAANLEANLNQENRVRSAMHRKWPALESRRSREAKQRIVESQRAARESFELADRHIQLSVEALASTGPQVETSATGD